MYLKYKSLVSLYRYIFPSFFCFLLSCLYTVTQKIDQIKIFIIDIVNYSMFYLPLSSPLPPFSKCFRYLKDSGFLKVASKTKISRHSILQFFKKSAKPSRLLLLKQLTFLQLPMCSILLPT